ncbi:MAG: hypothetical protein HYV29_02530 [Ignavibacteriales bacterium]|nr:hypothetical protein [Ignavibacteriales bacterium]
MKIFFASVLIISFTAAQLKTVSIEQIQLPKTETWSNPCFSPSGKEIFLTNADHNGIWQYSFETKLLKVITRDLQSGYNFSVSPDGNKVAYRRTTAAGDYRTRVQESIELDLKTNSHTSIQKGNSVPVPVFYSGQAITREKILPKNKLQIASSDVAVLGIENTKIVLLVNGEKKIFDPLNGQYVWPVISPDKKRIAAVDMDRGAFVCTVDGNNLMPLGRFDSPRWEKGGKWIVGMDDTDDGHKIISSDILAKSYDGRITTNLTEYFSGIAMYPVCSPRENKIIFSTYDGNVFILTYEEVQ